ncbi:MAG: UvrD-helicase domain-containing protein [Planctomycetaceae bacterium]
MSSHPVDLTPSQWEAVDHLKGPLLILAGPGSGKTRVITRRIARMTERGVDPREILAITFTNKAANEMRERVAHLLPGGRVWVTTFHKFCARVLRQRAEAIGLGPNFTIYDTADTKQLIKRALFELNIDAVHYPPGLIAARISNAKNDMQAPGDFTRQFEQRVGDHLQAVVARVYPEYQRSLLDANAVDFDDLLLHVVQLLHENPELRAELDARFRYVLVDEYQDTNLAQYRIVAALSHDHPNLCVTGDPDQSIYGWRGARIDNILRFESEFPAATVVRLEQNFRSTKSILRAADSLIAHNRHRKPKSLITDNPSGEPVELLIFIDNRHEADAIARQICQSVESGERSWSDFAIFYRVNALSREIERALVRHRVPYQVAAGAAFYERAEVKDALAYLRLISNPRDEAAFRRIVNRPVRGIGKKSLSQLTEWTRGHSLSLMDAATTSGQIPQLSKRATQALQAFAALIDECAPRPGQSVEDVLRTMLDRTHLAREWTVSGAEKDQQRVDNVQELLTAARQYDREAGHEATLEGYLESTSLVSEVDSLDDASGAVTLMTLHAAKGLEFPVVYLVAVEQNLIPHERSIKSEDPREYEEERRLLFVGITRARERLFLTQTLSRDFRGKPLQTIPSDFLREMEISFRDVSPDVFARSREPDSATEEALRAVTAAPGPGTTATRAMLTTAAELLNGTAAADKPVELPLGFAVGMEVRHPQHGLGTVINVGGFSKRRTVTVRFRKSDREQTFIASKCPLQPVGLD